jgi:hypothetical protein
MQSESSGSCALDAGVADARRQDALQIVDEAARDEQCLDAGLVEPRDWLALDREDHGVKRPLGQCACGLGHIPSVRQDDFTGPVNLGNPGEFTLRELAEKILALTGSRSKLIHQSLPADDPRQRQPDITLAKEVLKWGPRISLEEGLERTIIYFDRMLSGTVEELRVVSA